MFQTLGYILIVHNLVKSGSKHEVIFLRKINVYAGMFLEILG